MKSRRICFHFLKRNESSMKHGSYFYRKGFKAKGVSRKGSEKEHKKKNKKKNTNTKCKDHLTFVYISSYSQIFTDKEIDTNIMYLHTVLL